jgi:MFS transporter, FSR family, fosmidomycin resistance protein
VKRLPLVILSIGHLAVDVTGGAVPAILPLLQAEFHLSYLLVAAIIATSNITSSIVQPVFGLASDKAAARYLLPLGVLLSVAGFAFIGLAPTYGALLVAVAVSGIGWRSTILKRPSRRPTSSGSAARPAWRFFRSAVT